MADHEGSDPVKESWPAAQIAALNDAVKGRTVDALEIGEARDHHYVLITFADGLQLRVECEHLESVDTIEAQHI